MIATTISWRSAARRAVIASIMVWWTATILATWGIAVLARSASTAATSTASAATTYNRFEALARETDFIRPSDQAFRNQQRQDFARRFASIHFFTQLSKQINHSVGHWLSAEYFDQLFIFAFVDVR